MFEHGLTSMEINQHWKIQYIKDDEKYPFLLFDNWYTPDEEKVVWIELDFYSALPKEHTQRAETGPVVARYENGRSYSKSFRHYPLGIFSKEGQKYSSILNTMYKFKTTEFHEIVDFCVPHSRSFHTHNVDSTTISYYEDSDYYDSHHDSSQWTFLCWFFREPKKFDGGNLIMNEPNVKIGLKHNRAIFFPSCFLHQVEPIKFRGEEMEANSGRYTITHWFWNHPL